MDNELQVINASDSAKALEIIFGKPEEGVIVGGSKREKQRRVKYWRKPDHPGATDAGWIMPGPDYMTDPPGHQRYKEMKRWSELPDSFGLELTGQPSTTISWEASPTQRAKPETWLSKFFANGGLTYVIQPNDGFGKAGTYLMPAEQLVSLGFHRRPGITELRPDLAEAVDIECPNEGCIQESNGQRRRFSGVTKAAAERALDAHMAHHKGGEGARSAGREVQKALEAMEAKGQKLDTEAIASIVAATIVALQQNQIVQVSTPEAKKYPDGKPNSSWKRAELMSYAADKGIPQPANKMKMTQPEWLEYVQKQELTTA